MARAQRHLTDGAARQTCLRALGLALAFGAVLQAQAPRSDTFAVTAARFLTATSPLVAPGVMLVERGKITAVGTPG